MGRSDEESDAITRVPAPPVPVAPVAAPPPPLSAALDPRRVRTARIVAIVADLLQIVCFPIFMAGWVSPLDDVVDVAVALVLVRLVGWHVAFVPSFIAEIVPGLDLIPTWTAAVWLATRGKGVARPARAAGEDRPSDPRSRPAGP